MFDLRLGMFLSCLCFVMMYIAINFLSRASLANSIYITIYIVVQRKIETLVHMHTYIVERGSE